ncbi:MAG: hypothetical protein ABIR39_10720 [Nocardioides sp.]|uniref:hypothetical protein n=1 Tax=Nocardioides sp. TaxID=35761 RepID=UPI003266E1B6
MNTLLSAPPTSFEDGRADDLFLDNVEGHGTDAEKTLAYRLPGLVLAQLCTPAPGIEQLVDVARRQANQLRQNSAVFGHGRYRSLAVIGASDHRTHLRESDAVRQDVLEDRILRLLSTEHYQPNSEHPLLHELVEFVYQATENTFDHARRSFDGELIKQVRTVAIERHQVGSGAGAVPIEDLVSTPGDSMSRYLGTLQARAARRGEDPEHLTLLAVTIADGGVGVAARMSNGFDVYDGALGDEFALVQQAVLPDGTTKPAGEPGRGAGLVKMMRATHRLRGRFELRTGRLALSRSYVDDHGTTPGDTDFRRRDSAAYQLEGSTQEHPLVAGTAVSVLFPMFDLGPNTKPSSKSRPDTARAHRSGVLV